MAASNKDEKAITTVPMRQLSEVAKLLEIELRKREIYKSAYDTVQTLRQLVTEGVSLEAAHKSYIEQKHKVDKDLHDLKQSAEKERQQVYNETETHKKQLWDKVKEAQETHASNKRRLENEIDLLVIKLDDLHQNYTKEHTARMKELDKVNFEIDAASKRLHEINREYSRVMDKIEEIRKIR